MDFVIHTLVNALLLFLAGKLVDGFEVRNPKAAIVGALVLALANWVVTPLLILLTLPITLLTLGLFTLVINAVVLMLVAALVRGFEIRGFWPALWGAGAIAIMSVILGVLFR